MHSWKLKQALENTIFGISMHIVAYSTFCFTATPWVQLVKDSSLNEIFYSECAVQIFSALGIIKLKLLIGSHTK